MQDLVREDFFIQLIGFIALGFTIALFQVNKRTMMLALQVCGSMLYTLHFLLLGATTGAAMNFIGGVRSFTFIRIGKNRSLYILALFIAAFCLAVVLTWQGPKSLLPLAGMIFGTIALWQTKPSRIRLIMLAASPPWLIYNLISGSYPGMIVETLAITSNLIGIYRFDLLKLSKKNS